MSAARETEASGGRRRETARRRARDLAFRIAYESELSGDRCGDLWTRLRGDETLSQDQAELVEDVVGALDRDGHDVDARLREAAEHWPLERLSATDRAVLRIATAELIARSGSPVAVVIDEAIELAKRYGSEESGRFVNGVLDRVARALRPRET